MYGRWENRRDHPGGRAVGAHGRIKADAPDGADHDDTEGDRHDPAGGDLADRRRDRVSGRCAQSLLFCQNQVDSAIQRSLSREGQKRFIAHHDDFSHRFLPE